MIRIRHHNVYHRAWPCGRERRAAGRDRRADLRPSMAIPSLVSYQAWYGIYQANKERHGKPGETRQTHARSPNQRSRGARYANKKRGAGPKKNNLRGPGGPAGFFWVRRVSFFFASRPPGNASTVMHSFSMYMCRFRMHGFSM